MSEVKISSYLIVIMIILSALMLVWTLNVISDTNQTHSPAAVSAFSA